jgi:hypothetical protein
MIRFFLTQTLSQRERGFRLASAVALLLCAPALAQETVTEDERRDAECIDLFNGPAPQLAQDLKGVPRDPWITRILGGFVGAEGPSKPAVRRGVGYGFQAQTEAMPFTVFASGGTQTGFWMSLSAMVNKLPDSFDYSGQVGLGVGRRRHGASWFFGRCRLGRTDLALEFVRWRFGGFQDLSTSGHPTVFQSGISLLVFTRGDVFSMSEYGFKGVRWTVSVADFQLAPRFYWGISGNLELWWLAGIVFRLGLELPVTDWPTTWDLGRGLALTVKASIGFGFEK